MLMITANTVRYIKLGRGGAWEGPSLDNGELHFGYRHTDHDLALAGDLGKIKDFLMNLGRPAQAASREAREVLDFYELGADCLWVTFARDHLWWTFAEPEVIWLGGDGRSHGERMRKSIGGWRNTDVNGMPLRMDSLSTRLTKVSSYRRTICRVEAADYLLRKINGLEEPIVNRGATLRKALSEVLQEAITSLHWHDFQTLVDIMFARSGWHRTSVLGGHQKTVDLEVEQVMTGEIAAVQVKSTATQKTLDDYIKRIDESGRFSRFFFVCHSPAGELKPPADRDDVLVWGGKELASSIIRIGLQDWVLEKIASDCNPTGCVSNGS
jgi:hypothetical protein